MSVDLQQAMLNTDWALLRMQKEWLLEDPENENRIGLIAWIDAIQDAVVDSGLMTELEVFGERT